MFHASYFNKSYFNGSYFTPITSIVIIPKDKTGVRGGRIVTTTHDITDEYLQTIIREDEEVLLMITAFLEINL